MAEKLGRRITGWYMSRYEQPSTYPAEAPRGPIVAITDEYASSGGDIVIQALKSYGIATVVGTQGIKPGSFTGAICPVPYETGTVVSKGAPA